MRFGTRVETLDTIGIFSFRSPEVCHAGRLLGILAMCLPCWLVYGVMRVRGRLLGNSSPDFLRLWKFTAFAGVD